MTVPFFHQVQKPVTDSKYGSQDHTWKSPEEEEGNDLVKSFERLQSLGCWERRREERFGRGGVLSVSNESSLILKERAHDDTEYSPLEIHFSPLVAQARQERSEFFLQTIGIPTYSVDDRSWLHGLVVGREELIIHSRGE